MWLRALQVHPPLLPLLLLPDPALRLQLRPLTFFEMTSPKRFHVQITEPDRSQPRIWTLGWNTTKISISLSVVTAILFSVKGG